MKVQILLATYNPDIDQFKKLLISLNAQTQKDVELICCDDYSDNHEAVHAAVNTYLPEIKWSYIRNESNIGCNKTFERLVTLGTARYFVFCDQDDIWHADKIKDLLEIMEREGPLLVYSDLQVIDKNDQVVARSLRTIRKRIAHMSGKGLWQRFLRRNSITGCTMLIRSETAKSALPFPSESVYIWDHWTSIWAAYNGVIAYLPKPTVSYRIHSENLVGTKKLVNICNKSTYVDSRINRELISLQFVLERLRANDHARVLIQNMLCSVQTRKKFILNPAIPNLIEFLKTYSADPLLFLFELLLALSPDNGALIIRIAKRSLF